MSITARRYYLLDKHNKVHVYMYNIYIYILLSLLLVCITKGIFSIWCEKKELVYNKTVAK